jgi:hypothetical protein
VPPGIGFIYTFRNPPGPQFQPRPKWSCSPAPSTVTPGFRPHLIHPDATSFRLLTPTVVEDFPLCLPSFGQCSQSGKIVFTCYIQQIDQICLMNADGSGRKQLTNFQATSFYASLSPDGTTIYFVSRHTGRSISIP